MQTGVFCVHKPGFFMIILLVWHLFQKLTITLLVQYYNLSVQQICSNKQS